MHRTPSTRFKVLVRVGIPAVTGLTLILYGVRLPAALFFLGGFTGILWWFTRSPRPKSEQPCSAVSCCHYLKDLSEDD